MFVTSVLFKVWFDYFTATLTIFTRFLYKWMFVTSLLFGVWFDYFTAILTIFTRFFFARIRLRLFYLNINNTIKFALFCSHHQYIKIYTIIVVSKKKIIFYNFGNCLILWKYLDKTTAYVLNYFIVSFIN